MKLDAKDQKILFLLSKNARMSYAELGKLTKLSRDVVKYRIDKLLESGIIKSFKTNINYRLLGFNEYDVYIRLINANDKIMHEIIDAFCENKFVTWVATTFGPYDLRISILAKDSEHLNRLIGEIELDYGKYFDEVEMVSLVKKFKINPQFLITSLFKELKDFKVPDKLLYRIDVKDDREVKLDKEDIEVLRFLGKDPRASLVNIAEKIGMSAEGVKYKIKRLEQKGVIKGCFAMIDGSKLGKIWCNFNFKLVGLDASKVEEIERYIVNQKNTTAAVRILGKWNLGMTVFAEDMKEIQQILVEFKNRFAVNLKGYDSLIIFESYKYPALAEGILDL